MQLAPALRSYPSAQLENSVHNQGVILRAAQDLKISRMQEILRPRRSLRMTGGGAYAEVSTIYQQAGQTG